MKTDTTLETETRKLTLLVIFMTIFVCVSHAAKNKQIKQVLRILDCIISPSHEWSG